jgi:molybdopterin-guanine dinucleotide biosynthesis protein A
MDAITRVLIIAAGSGTRWGDYRGVPKHLVEVEGEVLIQRTARQFLKYTDDVVVVGHDERYVVEGTRLFIPTDKNENEMYKFASSFDAWGGDRVVLAYGDAYFTDDAIEKIMSDKSEWKLFCRSTPSEITGKNCKELFAYALDISLAEKFKSAITKLMSIPNITGGWTLFRELTLGNTDVAKTDRRMFDTGNHVEINDWTEDFDYPVDLENWERKRMDALTND